MKLVLPKFMGFDGIGILLKDTKTSELYTISENFDKIDLDYEMGDEFRKSTIIKFPSSLGVTGYVFGSGELYAANRAKKDTKYSADIDNLTNIGEVNNFLIGPIFGHPNNNN